MAVKKAKHILESKTFWVGLATFVSGIGFLFTGEKELQEALLTIAGALSIILRAVTVDPVRLKKN